MLVWLSGTENVAVEIVYGSGDTDKESMVDHHRNLENFKNLKLNMRKAKIGLSKVQFIGHILTEDGVKPDREKITAVKIAENLMEKSINTQTNANLALLD